MFKTRAGIDKNAKILGGNSQYKSWVSGKQAESFKVLFEYIKKRIGTHKGAKKYVGLSNKTDDNLNQGRISETTAKKILDAYNKLKEQENV